jgi:putative zinc finger/helix-turn-helix YgiT family protein
MKCINCGKAELIRGAVPLAVTVAGVEFTTELPGRRCPACGYSTANGPAALRFELLVAAELVKRGLRSGASFKFMRKALGMKAIEVAEAFNVAPETISRWENDQRAIDWPEFMLLGFLIDDKLAGRTTTLSRLKALGEPAQEEDRVMIPFQAA